MKQEKTKKLQGLEEDILTVTDNKVVKKVNKTDSSLDNLIDELNLNSKVKKLNNKDLKVRIANIKVIGVGGAGGNTINRMIEDGLTGVEFIAINTDIQDLIQSKANIKIHIGDTTTNGLGAGGQTDRGKSACEESREEIEEYLTGADMVFVTAGMGGGTGTGAAPVVCEIARNLGALTVAIVTKPFSWEGKIKSQVAEEGIAALESVTDALIVVHNDNLFKVVDKKSSIIEAFKAGDEVLKQSVKGISDLITKKGYINVDFADINSILKSAGKALIGIGRGTGEHRAKDAATKAISSLLADTTIEGASAVLYNVTAPADFNPMEMEEAATIIKKSVDPGARIIFGLIIDETLKDEVYLTLIATGFNNIMPDDFSVNETEHIEEEKTFIRTNSIGMKKNNTMSSSPTPAAIISPWKDDYPPVFRK